MKRYFCDVCGEVLPDDYVPHKHGAGSMSDLCGCPDVCARCALATKRVNVRELLLAAWRAAASLDQKQAQPASRDGSPEAMEKREISERLISYRRTHGLGCLAKVSATIRCGDITDDVLRDVISGSAILTMAQWRRISRALDKLANEERAGRKRNAEQRDSDGTAGS